jgi:transcriptional regulator with XRE-family HTH domain
LASRLKDVLEKYRPGAVTPGELLRAFRKRDNFTLKDMEDITGIRESNLSAIENGNIVMTQHYAELFAAALQVHPSLFLYPNGEFAKDERLLEIERKAKLRRKLG